MTNFEDFLKVPELTIVLSFIYIESFLAVRSIYRFKTKCNKLCFYAAVTNAHFYRWQLPAFDDAPMTEKNSKIFLRNDALKDVGLFQFEIRMVFFQMSEI